ncbi:MAG: two-component system, chemotaxis family, chemotaxis protein CheY [Verrucomicrobiota bacterium]|jgi:DNA-binding response OmpR family regulator
MARIIVIDDDPEMRSLLEQVLWTAGHDVVTAEEGRIGLAYSRASRVDLLITDLVMPGMEGMETIRRFRKEFEGVPIVAISGNPDLGNILDTAHRLGAVRTLAKPFQAAEFLKLVQEILESPPSARSGELKP